MAARFGAPDAPLPREFYNRDVLVVARELIGCTLRRHWRDGSVSDGRIVETEAYRHDDPASHSFRGLSPRNASMFGPPGHAYVYLIYGVHHCFNVVCGPPGRADAVLIRAIEPRTGIQPLIANRSVSVGRPVDIFSLASGPGKLCQALGITIPDVDGTSLCSGPVTIHQPRGPVPSIGTTRRIGISRATGHEWRFIENGSPFLSRSREARAGRRKRR